MRYARLQIGGALLCLLSITTTAQERLSITEQRDCPIEIVSYTVHDSKPVRFLNPYGTSSFGVKIRNNDETRTVLEVEYEITVKDDLRRTEVDYLYPYYRKHSIKPGNASTRYLDLGFVWFPSRYAIAARIIKVRFTDGSMWKADDID